MTFGDTARQRLVNLLGPRRAVVDDRERLEPYGQDESGLGSYPPEAVAAE